MEARQLYNYLLSRELTLTVEGSRLQIWGEKSLFLHLNPEIKAHKDELIEFVRGEPTSEMCNLRDVAAFRLGGLSVGYDLLSETEQRARVALASSLTTAFDSSWRARDVEGMRAAIAAVGRPDGEPAHPTLPATPPERATSQPSPAAGQSGGLGSTDVQDTQPTLWGSL